MSLAEMIVRLSSQGMAIQFNPAPSMSETLAIFMIRLGDDGPFWTMQDDRTLQVTSTPPHITRYISSRSTKGAMIEMELCDRLREMAAELGVNL